MDLEHTQGAELLKAFAHTRTKWRDFPSLLTGDSRGSRHIPSLSRDSLDSHPPEESKCLGTAL